MNVAGSLRVPGDKSISHRSLMSRCARDGESRITEFSSRPTSLDGRRLARARRRDPELSSDFVVRGAVRSL
jgi:5-enolpyruvylshikimate-3-phosphate synthase